MKANQCKYCKTAAQEIASLTAQLDASRVLLAERDAEIGRLELIEVVYRAIINNTHIAEDERLAKIIELTEQLTASQQEVERLTIISNDHRIQAGINGREADELRDQLAASQQECEELRLANNQLAAAAICPDDRLPENVRKQAARECLDIIRSMKSCSELVEIKYRIMLKFGLEG